MAEPRIRDEDLGRALLTLGRDLALPPTPSLASAVTSRLLTDRARSVRRPFPGAALWTRRRVLVLATVALVSLLALAAAARLVIGAIEIRVQPNASPTASLPPVEPDVLGTPVPLEDLAAVAGLEPGLPAGPAPDRAYVVEGPEGVSGVVLAWRPSVRYPIVPGTEWGLLLMAFGSDSETIVKTIAPFEDTLDVSVNGEPAYWIPIPHRIAIETDRGVVELVTRGHVLIWQVGDLTYRIETSLDRAAALEIARSVS